MATIPAGNAPFLGGSITRTGRAEVAGAIPSANTSVGNPSAGVNPGTPFYARNNQGSNVGIPYARLCPLGSKDSTGLPPVPTATSTAKQSKDPYRKKNPTLTETEDLRSTTVAFILGRRTDTTSGTRLSINDDDSAAAGLYGSGFNFNVAGTMLAPGVPGTERYQKLCSFEYLVRYFGTVLYDKGFTLDDTVVGNDFSGPKWATGLPRMVADMARSNTSDDALDTHLTNTATLLHMGDIAQKMGMAESQVRKATPIRQGIFTRDCGPFLRGKGISHYVLEGSSNAMRPYHVSRCAGDELAFAFLERMLEEAGVTDWRPDGIVLSKGADDPSDKLSDEYLKARDGELFNIRVQGPAVTSSWTGDPSLEMMPLDKVFVLVVADVWWGETSALDKPIKDFVEEAVKNGGTINLEKLNAYLGARETELSCHKSGGQGLQQETRKTRKKKINEEVVSVEGYSPYEEFEEKSQKVFDGTDKEESHLCNFRVVLSTSSQMINYSRLRFGSDGKQLVDETAGQREYSKVGAQSRMGLRLGERGGEYVVGGWCIGNVLDTAASRAGFPSSGNIGVRTAPNSMAVNLNVNIEWWDADRLWRSYMNADGKLTPRYMMTKMDSELQTINRPPEGLVDAAGVCANEAKAKSLAFVA
jgi:hypothetical protein